MNSFKLNKILGALLGTCLVLLAVHIASGAIFAPQVPAKPGYVIEVKQEQQPAKEGAGGGDGLEATRDGRGGMIGECRTADAARIEHEAAARHLTHLLIVAVAA